MFDQVRDLFKETNNKDQVFFIDKTGEKNITQWLRLQNLIIKEHGSNKHNEKEQARVNPKFFK